MLVFSSEKKKQVVYFYTTRLEPRLGNAQIFINTSNNLTSILLVSP